MVRYRQLTAMTNGVWSQINCRAAMPVPQALDFHVRATAGRCRYAASRSHRGLHGLLCIVRTCQYCGFILPRPKERAPAQLVSCHRAPPVLRANPPASHLQRVQDMEEGLPPCRRHLPVAYHGRASSIVISGTPVRRPHGQLAPLGDSAAARHEPSEVVDFELEMVRRCVGCAAVEGLRTPLRAEASRLRVARAHPNPHGCCRAA